MEKFLAIVFLVLFAWWAIPHLEKAEWLAPAAVPSYWWGYEGPYNAGAYIPPQPDLSYRRFDFWHGL